MCLPWIEGCVRGAIAVQVENFVIDNIYINNLIRLRQQPFLYLDRLTTKNIIIITYFFITCYQDIFK